MTTTIQQRLQSWFDTNLPGPRVDSSALVAETAVSHSPLRTTERVEDALVRARRLIEGGSAADALPVLTGMRFFGNFDPKLVQAIRLKAVAYHQLGDFQAAWDEWEAAKTQFPQARVEQHRYRRELKQLASELESDRSRSGGEDLLKEGERLATLEKIYQVLGDEPSASVVQARREVIRIPLEVASQERDLTELKTLAERWAADGLLSAAAIARVEQDPKQGFPLSDYLRISESSDGKPCLEFLPEFERPPAGISKSELQRKVLAQLEPAVMEGTLRRLAESAPDAGRRSYYQAKVDLMEGKPESARLSFAGALRIPGDDPESSAMRAEAAEFLRSFALGTVQQLRSDNEQLQAQRRNHLFNKEEGSLWVDRDQIRDTARRNARLLQAIETQLDHGAATLDAALVSLQREAESIPESASSEVWRYYQELPGTDPDFAALLSFESSESIAERLTESGKRAAHLSLARSLRHPNGSYAISERQLEVAMADELEQAGVELADAIVAIRSDATRGYESVRLREKLAAARAKLKDDDRLEYFARYGEAPSAEQIEAELASAQQDYIHHRVLGISSAVMERRFADGSMADPAARDAWSEYKDLVDPFNELSDFSDQGRDALMDEAVITALTLPITLGVGSALRGAVASSRLARRISAAGRLGEAAVQVATFTASSAAEALTQEILTAPFAGQFQAKNIGYNFVMSVGFHAGNQIWMREAESLGIDVAARAQIGSRWTQRALAALDTGGALATQTTVATGLSLVQDPESEQTISERIGASAIRMLGAHGFSKLIAARPRAKARETADAALPERETKVDLLPEVEARPKIAIPESPAQLREVRELANALPFQTGMLKGIALPTDSFFPFHAHVNWPNLSLNIFGTARARRVVDFLSQKYGERFQAMKSPEGATNYRLSDIDGTTLAEVEISIQARGTGCMAARKVYREFVRTELPVLRRWAGEASERGAYADKVLQMLAAHRDLFGKNRYHTEELEDLATVADYLKEARVLALEWQLRDRAEKALERPEFRSSHAELRRTLMELRETSEAARHGIPIEELYRGKISAEYGLLHRHYRNAQAQLLEKLNAAENEAADLAPTGSSGAAARPSSDLRHFSETELAGLQALNLGGLGALSNPMHYAYRTALVEGIRTLVKTPETGDAALRENAIMRLVGALRQSIDRLALEADGKQRIKELLGRAMAAVGRNPGGSPEAGLANVAEWITPTDSARAAIVLADLDTFNGYRPSLVGVIPGLTPGLESVFERGGLVRNWRGVFTLVQRPSGAETEVSQAATLKDYVIYQDWQSRQWSGLPRGESARPAVEGLFRRAHDLGITLKFGEHRHPLPSLSSEALSKILTEYGPQLAYLDALFAQIPAAALRETKLSAIHLQAPRFLPGHFSAYHEASGTIHIYRGALEGSRRNFAGLFLHELGHAFEQRYAGEVNDARIPEPIRQKMWSTYQTLLKSQALLGLDYLDGVAGRIENQSRRGVVGLKEFLAEFNVAYVAAGAKLRAHIASFSEGGALRDAWDFIYEEWQRRIFPGRESGPIDAPGLPREQEAKLYLDALESKLSHSEMQNPKIDWSSRYEDRTRISAGTDQGRFYARHNEDRYAVVEFPDGRSILVSIDGMGGHAGGERAAELVRAVMERALREGKSPDAALELANAAVYEDNRRQGFVETDYDGEEFLMQGSPGAVAIAVELAPDAGGKKRARFFQIGDADSVVIRPGNGQIVHYTTRPTQYAQKFRGGERYRLTPDGRLDRGQTLILRMDPLANRVEEILGAKQTRIHRSEASDLQSGDIVIAGSDGLFENFGSLDILAQVVRASGATRAAEIRQCLMDEALLRMVLAKKFEGHQLDRAAYRQAYREVHGQEAPENWRGMYEPFQDERGQVHSYYLDGGNVYHRPSGQPVDHFKKDNVNVIVQVLD